MRLSFEISLPNLVRIVCASARMHIYSSCFKLLLETSPLEFANAPSPDRRSKQASEDACTGPTFLDSLMKAKDKLLAVKDQSQLDRCNCQA